MRRHLARFAFSLLLASGVAGLALRAQDAVSQDAAAAAQSEYQWPRLIQDGDTTFMVYQPQVDVFENARFEARAAVQVDTRVGEKTQTTYGVVWITANASIDKENRLVQLDDIQVTKANFPTAVDKTEQYLEIFRRNTEGTRTASLDRIEANLAVTHADKLGNAVPLKNDPPRIYYRTHPAVLVLIDGDPALRPVEGEPGIERVINTRALILKTAGAFYMPIADRWLVASSTTGPWRIASSVPSAVQGIRDGIAGDKNQSQVDLMEETSDDVKGVLAEGGTPEVIVTTVPAELLVTQGQPQMKPVTDTQLLYVENTSGDILFDLKDQSYYVPLTGRWFRSKSLDGPWKFVEGDKLPKDFAKIPQGDPKSSVLATVPGTPAAQEAAIANSIPQTAEVNRAEARFESRFDGEPRFEDVPETPLQYAVNSPTPIVRVDGTTYYAVQDGVWFTSASPLGPWIVATEVPEVIYTIPTESPIHYVTYVRIYRSTPTEVWVGYTPGYLGTCYSPWGTVVYGTGWYYPPWIGSYWYGSPWTWGFGAGFYWSSWSGWGWSFGWGGYTPYYSPWWGPYYGWHHRPPYRRPPYYGGGPGPHGRPGYRPPRENWNNTNVYNRPGAPRPGVRPSARPSRPVGSPPARPGQPAPRPGQPSTRPSRPDNIYAGPDGNVYRPRPGKPGTWETNDRGSWRQVQPARPEARPSQPSQPSTRPAQPSTRPEPGRPTVDPRTINQLSRDQQGRRAGDSRMRPPPVSRPPASSPRPPSAPRAPSSRPAPAPRPPRP